jgi:protein-tyrosine phosphatase
MAKSKVSRKLSIDYLQYDQPSSLDKNRIALSPLPGRKDHKRNLEQDLEQLRQENISNVMCLITKDELEHYGVKNLIQKFESAGMQVYHFPILDMGIPTKQETKTAINWLYGKVSLGEKGLIHCVGGLGRSGTIAACYLKTLGLSAEEAIKIVRKSRSQHAIENKAQEDFIANY